MNRNKFRIVQILASCLLLAFVCHQVGLFSAQGRLAFVDTVKDAHLGLLMLSVAVGVIVNMSSALKWFMLARARDLKAGYWRFFSYYLVGQFYNLILPTSVGGDVVRAYELGKYSGKHADALASVFVERYTGVLVLLLISGIAVLSQLSLFSDDDFILFSLMAFALGLSFIAWVVFDSRVYAQLRLFFCKHIPPSKAAFVKLDKLLLSVRVYSEEPTALIWAFVNSIVFYALAVINVYVTALVFNHDVQVVDMLIATPIIMLIMNIPLSVGNLGLMEFAYISIFQLMGYSPALGLSVAILMRLKSLFDGAMGGVLHPFFVTEDQRKQ